MLRYTVDNTLAADEFLRGPLEKAATLRFPPRFPRA